ncbi:hypothetical protein IRJ41_021869 [Triplophysa rosa]|uniref:Ig-like domain-containing protein n=1 Tax=Triplophysa rosa TaxID=992332 RepID=A0A9W7T8I4_TRIRA|nr:hypothetical protein IRJ41_021869 [Triplophysa rosa]
MQEASVVVSGNGSLWWLEELLTGTGVTTTQLLSLNTLCVFGDEVKSVSVTEGHSVTLHTDTELHTDDKIMWYYGPENTFVARITRKDESTMLSDDEIFRDRLKMNNQTASLIITHITSQHSGLYTLKISSNNKVSYKIFNITANTRLPVPIISRDSSQCSSSSSSSCCCVLCSVMNVSHDVSVSWYKGKSLLSSISVSDLNIRLSLPLEVEYQDTNTYRCVVNNHITNHTQHLHITQICHTSEDSHNMMVIIPLVVCALMICVVCMIIIVNSSSLTHEEEKSSQRLISSEAEDMNGQENFGQKQ